MVYIDARQKIFNHLSENEARRGLPGLLLVGLVRSRAGFLDGLGQPRLVPIRFSPEIALTEPAMHVRVFASVVV